MSIRIPHNPSSTSASLEIINPFSKCKIASLSRQ